MKMNTGLFLLAGLILAVIFLAGCTQQPVACTADAKLCPDGSAVGRTLPNCEFAACPNPGQTQGITLVTDKVAYAAGEIVSVELQNNSSQPIFVNNMLGFLDAVYQKKEDGSFEKLLIRNPNLKVDALSQMTKIDTGKKIEGGWNGEAYQRDTNINAFETNAWKPYQAVGTFRLETSYSFDINKLGDNHSILKPPIAKIRSNEFEIAQITTATCIENWTIQNLQPDRDFVSKEILVGFAYAVDENTAKEIIGSYNLEIKNLHNISIGILITAAVPEGKEFEWICMLGEDSRIKYAQPNLIAYPAANASNVVKNSWNYCAQFSGENCSGNFYTPIPSDNYSDTIECVWNNQLNQCTAGIGYI